jgi:hypothetical protein
MKRKNKMIQEFILAELTDAERAKILKRSEKSISDLLPFSAGSDTTHPT